MHIFLQQFNVTSKGYIFLYFFLFLTVNRMKAKNADNRKEACVFI